MGASHAECATRRIVEQQREIDKWFRKAAEQDEPNAQVNLLSMYEDGQGGLPWDDKQAIELNR